MFDTRHRNRFGRMSNLLGIDKMYVGTSLRHTNTNNITIYYICTNIIFLIFYFSNIPISTQYIKYISANALQRDKNRHFKITFPIFDAAQCNAANTDNTRKTSKIIT